MIFSRKVVLDGFCFAGVFCFFLFMVARNPPNVLNMSTKHDSPKGSFLKHDIKKSGKCNNVKEDLNLKCGGLATSLERARVV